MTDLHAQNASKVSPDKKTELVANVNVKVKAMYATQKVENVKVVLVIQWVSTKKCLIVSSCTVFQFTHRNKLPCFWTRPLLAGMKSTVSVSRSVSQ